MQNKIKKSNPGLGGEASVKTKKMNKTKLYTLVLLVGVGMVAWSLFSKQDVQEEEVLNMENENNIEQTENVTDNAPEQVSGGPNSIDGTLMHSDDANRGNFKLVSKLGDIYIRTSRDFSKLVGLQVLVLMDGTLDKFELIDIQSAVQKDGFIISQ